MSERMMIIGAGEAGTAAAIALRDGGYVHDIILTGAEQHAPYERPPLSKHVITHEGDVSLPHISVAANLQSLTSSMCNKRLLTSTPRPKRHAAPPGAN